MFVYDLLFGDDLEIGSDGDLVVGESTEQHISDLIMLNKGELRTSPETGVGLEQWVLDNADVLGLEQEIQKQMELDGMKVIENKNGVVKGYYV